MGSKAITLDGQGARSRALAILVLGMCLALAVAPAPARATILEQLSTQDMSRRAATVVVGTVLSTSVEVHGGNARTAVRIAVTDALKGAPGAVATVFVPGGRLPNGMVEIVDEMPAFLPGETCAVFVDSRGWVMAGHQGKVGLSGGRIRSSGRPVADLAAAVRAANGPIVFGQVAADPLAASAALTASGLTAAAAPTITSISPGSVAAGIGARITIAGSGFGATPGTVTFFYRAGQPRIPANVIDSWSDTQIVCDVPVGTVNGYSASAGSDPVEVTTALGAIATRGIDVQFGNGQRQWADSFAASPRARVGYRINPSGVPQAESLFDAAAGVWNSAGADFLFIDEGVINTAPVGGDGHNDINWASGLPAGVIAQASTWTWNGTIVECQITFSTAFTWGNGSGSTMDIESIAIHEIGHWLFLRDLYGSGDSAKVMYGFSSTGSVKRTLSSGDVAGIRHIYGAAPVADTLAPTTASNAVGTYSGHADITLTPTDTGGSGVAATYYRLDGGTQTAGTSLTVSAPGGHTLEFWSVDAAGNTETPHKTATFSITVPDTAPPHTDSDAVSTYSGYAAVTLSPSDTGGSGLAGTSYRVDGGSIRSGTSVTVTGVGGHTLEFWSVDVAGNVELPHHTVTFDITAVSDSTPPQTTSDALSSYTGPANITLSPTDGGGSGVAETYYILDGVTGSGTSVVVTAAGAHVLEFWSEDGSGNEESPHKTVTFTIAAAPAPAPVPVPTAITIARSTSSVRLPKPFTLSGRLTPGAYRDPCVVEVKKPGSARWSYSSARLAHTSAGDWWYRYTPKSRGTYAFRARFAGDASRLGSLSGIVAVSVR